MARKKSISILARTPAPNVFEALPSYLLRLSVANGQKSPARIYNRLRPSLIHRQVIGMRFTLDDLGALTGRSMLELSRLGQTCASSGFSAICTPQGHHALDPVEKRALKAPMHCPDCAQEDGSIDASWSLEVFRVCTRHQRFGLSSCGSCGAEIRWERRALNECNCGWKFLDSVRVQPSFAEMGCADVLRASLVPNYQSSEIPANYGFPIEALSPLEYPTLIKLLRELSYFFERVQGVRESSSEMLHRAGIVLRQWPLRFWVLVRRAHNTLGDVGLVDLLFNRTIGLISESVRRTNFDVNPFWFLIEAARQYVEHAGLTSIVDRRVWVTITDVDEPSCHSVYGVSKQVGFDQMAIIKLVDRGVLNATKNAKVRLVIDPLDVVEIKEAWSTINGRDASRLLGIPVRTFRCCIAEGLINSSSLQSEARGYSTVEVRKFGERLDAAAAQCNAILGADSLSLNDVMRSSSYSTPFKFSLVQSLIAGGLVTLANGTVFKDLRVHRSICGLGSMASMSIKDDMVVGAYAQQMLMCSESMLDRLIVDELIKGQRRGRVTLVDRRSLLVFASRWISDRKICNSIGWDFRPSKLSEMLGKAGKPLRYGKTAFFARRSVPDVRGLALLAFGES